MHWLDQSTRDCMQGQEFWLDNPRQTTSRDSFRKGKEHLHVARQVRNVLHVTFTPGYEWKLQAMKRNTDKEKCILRLGEEKIKHVLLDY